MAEQTQPALDELVRKYPAAELAKRLVALQETQREAKVLFSATSNDDAFDNKGQDYSDSVEYDFMRGLRKVPECLRPYLDTQGDLRERVLKAAGFIYSRAKEIAKEILDTRGPLPARKEDPYGEGPIPGGSHAHYPMCGKFCETIMDELLKDTIQSLKDYSTSIEHVRYASKKNNMEESK